MAKYAYPAVFTKEEAGYSVMFPDLPDVFTSGVTLPEAIEMAEDALCLMLYTKEERQININHASNIKEIEINDNEIVSMVSCDTVKYREMYCNKSVKKSVSLPQWLDTIAEREGVNFSVVLQNALKEKLDLY